MRTDAQIQQDIMAELKWKPQIQASEIGVAVKDGVVTLSGIMDTYAKKIAAESAAKHILGVHAVALDIQVGQSPLFKRTDTEIAEAIINTLKQHTGIDHSKIKVEVEDGNVTLTGEVEWEYQRDYCKTSIEYLAGVRNVFNFITLRPRAMAADVKQKITGAFYRNATIDSGKINVDVIGSKVILRGHVRSLTEKEDAAMAAWSAPGVDSVDNRLEVEIEELVM
jgi:osmotically-inducible protein OsmY